MPTFAPQFLYGERLSASKMNRTSTLVNSLVRAQGLAPTPVVGMAPVMLQALEVESIDDANRLLNCVTPDAAADPNADRYVVGLPPIFTEPSRDGVTYAYTDLNTRVAGGSETQEITPKFVVGESVIVIFNHQAQELMFLGDGRMWAQVP